MKLYNFKAQVLVRSFHLGTFSCFPFRGLVAGNITCGLLFVLRLNYIKTLELTCFTQKTCTFILYR